MLGLELFFGSSRKWLAGHSPLRAARILNHGIPSLRTRRLELAGRARAPGSVCSECLHSELKTQLCLGLLQTKQITYEAKDN